MVIDAQYLTVAGTSDPRPAFGFPKHPQAAGLQQTRTATR